MIKLKQLLTEASKGTIHVFDVDGTLVNTDSKIGYKLPNDKKWTWVDCHVFKHIQNDIIKNGAEIDLSQFDDDSGVLYFIKTGTVIKKTLKYIDKAVRSGQQIGVLTARKCEEAVYKALTTKILYKKKDGTFESLPDWATDRSLFFAVGDHKYDKYFRLGQKTPNEEKKATTLQKWIADKCGYKKIFFYDDDQKNVDAVNNLHDKRIKGIKI